MEYGRGTCQAKIGPCLDVKRYEGQKTVQSRTRDSIAFGLAVKPSVPLSHSWVDAPRSSVGKVSCPSGQRTQVRTPVAEWSGKSNCGRMVREVKLPGELDTTDTHTDARSAKKDVISTKPQKAMGVERTFPQRTKKGDAPPPCAVSPAMCRQLGHAILCSQGKRGRGAVPLV